MMTGGEVRYQEPRDSHARRCDNVRLFQIIVFFLVLTIPGIVSNVTGEVRIFTPESLNLSEPVTPGELLADFFGTPTTGRVALMVKFFDLSEGNPSEWHWDFGDGSTSVSENPLHTYFRGGIYTVRLSVYRPDGSSDTIVKENYIVARPLPLDANFTVYPLSGPAPLTVQCTDHSTGAMIWLWNFGDGSQESMIPDPSHTFLNPGMYKVRLKVGNGLGESDMHEEVINVSSSEQVTADFVGSPTTGPAPLTVQFTDRSTGMITSWFWDFGDGSIDTTRNPVHTYVKYGIYPVTLTVSSADSNPDTEQKMNYITVTDSPVAGSIPLSPGWNFVSVPGELKSGNDTAEIFEHVDTDGHSAFQYHPNNGGWTTLTRSSPVRPLDALWIFSKQSYEVPVTFEPVVGQTPSRMLVKGWNAAGFTGFNPAEAKQALFSVKDTWQHCIGYNREQQKYDDMIFKGVNDDNLVYPYGGYWVYMAGEGVLTGFSS